MNTHVFFVTLTCVALLMLVFACGYTIRYHEWWPLRAAAALGISLALAVIAGLLVP